MYKLVILIDQPEDEMRFNEQWATFLSWTEQIPGLQRATTARVAHSIFGTARINMIYEMYFDTLEEIYQGMNSPNGARAGQLLQLMTKGKVNLLLADHHEDTGENLRKYRSIDKANA